MLAGKYVKNADKPRSGTRAGDVPGQKYPAQVVKVVYLGGWGRSGTTVLADLLGAHQGVFSGGEIRYLWQRGVLGGRLCGCGKPVSGCELWQRVRKAAYGSAEPDPRHVVALQDEVARVRNTPRLLWSRRTRNSAALAEYRQLLTRLYQGIAEVTGARLIVDSSKYPSDAAIVAGLAGVEQYLVHVIRDPRAVAYSWQRPKTQLDLPTKPDMVKHSTTNSSLNWVAINLALERVGRRYGSRRRLLRYESFADDPAGQVAELLEFLGMPDDGCPFVSRHEATLGANHTVSGNPSRFATGAVTLAPDTEYQARQPVTTRNLVTGLTLPVLLRYRYPVRVARG